MLKYFSRKNENFTVKKTAIWDRARILRFNVKII